MALTEGDRHITARRGRTWAGLDERSRQTPDPSAAIYEAAADVRK